MERACFLCGSTDHIMRDCPRNASRVQQVEEEEEEGPEVLFIGNVQERRDDELWRRVPMTVTLGDFHQAWGGEEGEGQEG